METLQEPLLLSRPKIAELTATSILIGLKMSQAPSAPRRVETGITLSIAVISLLVSFAGLYFSQRKDISIDLKNSTRDWQKGLVFSTLLQSDGPVTVDEIESKYRTSASAYRDKYNLTDASFSREEIYNVLLELIAGQSIKLRDNKYFSVKTDEDQVQDRRTAFDMLEFALINEYKYGYDEFAAQFSDWYRKNRKNGMTKERALAILSLAMQSNIIGMAVKPGFRISCYGETPPLYVATNFSIRSSAPAILPGPGQIPNCPPKQ